jgi:hypothetical protein
MRTHQSFPQTPEPSYLSRQKRFTSNFSGESATDNCKSFEHSDFKILLNDGLDRVSAGSEEKNEQIRISKVIRKKDFKYTERIDGGRQINVLGGLELHTRVFNTEEQENIVEYVYKLQSMGQRGKLRGIYSYMNPPFYLFRVFKSLIFSAVFCTCFISVSISGFYGAKVS